MAKYLIEVKPHVEEGCTTIEIDNLWVGFRFATHCPRDWKVNTVTTNGITILSTDKILSKDDVQKVVDEYLNPEIIEVV